MYRYPSGCTVFMLVCLFFGAAAQAQTTWHVDDDASMGGDGLTWQTAYKYLQDALAVAAYGDEIRVAGGTYIPDQDEAGNVTPGDREAAFQLISGVEVFGGYRGLAGGGNGDDRDTALFETILSGDLSADDHSGGDNTENSYQVVTGSGASATALLNGFTITAGNADGPDTYPMFPNRGGGMYNYRGSPTVMNCIFSNNSAALGGGGLNNEQSDPTLINCMFRGNTAFFSGGGMRGWESGPTLFNCAFTGNTAESGGVAWHGASTAAYTNCTFSSNSAPLGNALGFDSCCPQQPSNVTLTNCVLWDGGNEIRNFDGSTITITYSDVQDADPNDGSVYPGLGNIDDYPRFVDADGTDNVPGTGDDNLRFMPGSPCSDAGDNTAVPPGETTDLDGNPRFIDDPDTPDTGNGLPPIVDMGAYEFQVCGNGVIDPGEECDDGGESATCDADCTVAECGDGTLNVTAGEECDDGNTSNEDDCLNTCVLNTCGDGHIDAQGADTEDCDDGNTDDGDCCSSTCQFEADGAPCDLDSDLCTIDECDGVGTCEYTGSDVQCHVPDPPCEAGQHCVTATGQCVDDADAAYGTPCPDDGNECTDDWCDGNGNCIHPDNGLCGVCCLPDPPKLGRPICNDDMIENTCLANDGVFVVGPGSDCLGDSDGDTVDDQCDVCPGEDDLADMDRNGIQDCLDPDFIPTISTWGLVVLALLLLTVAKIHFGQRRPVRGAVPM